MLVTQQNENNLSSTFQDEYLMECLEHLSKFPIDVAKPYSMGGCRYSLKISKPVGESTNLTTPAPIIASDAIRKLAGDKLFDSKKTLSEIELSKDKPWSVELELKSFVGKDNDKIISRLIIQCPDNNPENWTISTTYTLSLGELSYSDFVSALDEHGRHNLHYAGKKSIAKAQKEELSGSTTSTSSNTLEKTALDPAL